MEWINWLIIGSGVGLIMGLTGAGGAIFSIPLFIYLLGVSTYDATIYALITVILGASLNAFAQRKDADYRIALTLGAFSILGSLVAKEIKDQAPTLLIQSLFITLCFFSLYQMWKKQKPASPDSKASRGIRILTFPTGGLFIGGLATITGLGGGILLVPWLKGILGLPSNRAVATSLTTITIVTLSSLVIQRNSIPVDFNYLMFIPLAGGIVLASRGMINIMKAFPGDRIDSVRKFAFTTVVLIAIISVYAKS